MRQLLFCYGTLMVPRLMATVIGRRARAVPAVLDGYQSAQLLGRSYPGLWRQAGAQVDGCCYWLNHRRELGRLDRYEGREYRRRRVTITTPGGPQTAWIYLPLSGGRRRGQAWSSKQFSRHHLSRYLRKIAHWRTCSIAGPADAGA